ncbi:MAG: right-handed parallel beta-helix repeat-containing protein [Planctomycetota bacterium]
MRRFTALVLTFALSGGLAAPTTWYVDDDNCPGPGSGSDSDPFCRIQDAIELAADGDTVLVLPGTYGELIDFRGKAITVRSSAGAAATIIDGQDQGTVVTFRSGEDRDSVLEGFTVTNGYREFWVSAGVVCRSQSSPTIVANIIHHNVSRGTYLYGAGAGVCCIGSSAPLIQQNIIRDNQAGRGAGIACLLASSPIIVANTIERNDHQGVYCDEGSHPWILRNRIANNTANGIECHWDCSPTIEGNEILDNGGSIDGGGIYCQNGSPRIVGNLMTGNFAYYRGGAISCYYAGAPEIRNNIIAYNWITGPYVPWGGGLYWGEGVTPTLVGNIVAYNKADLGAGMFCIGRGHLSCNTFFGNDAEEEGGGIYCTSGAHVTISNCIVWGNEAPKSPEIAGGPAVTYSDVRGGWAGEGNIDADPLFADVATLDLRLRRYSPCIDAGDPAEQPCLEADLLGNPRLLDGDLDRLMRLDMGACSFANVHLDISGEPHPGSVLTFTTSGTAGLTVWLAAGTQSGAICIDPFGAFFVDTGSPFWLLWWGGIPAPGSYDVRLRVPLDLPVPSDFVFQEIALDLRTASGNTSNALELTVE